MQEQPQSNTSFWDWGKCSSETCIVKLQREQPGQMSCRLAVKRTFHSSPQPDHLICVFPGASPLLDLITPFLNRFIAPLSASLKCIFFLVWVRAYSFFLCSYHFFRVEHEHQASCCITQMCLRVTASVYCKQLQWRREISAMLQIIICKLYILKPSGNMWLPMSLKSHPRSFSVPVTPLVFIRLHRSVSQLLNLT